MKKSTYWRSRHVCLYGIVLALVALCFVGCKSDNEQGEEPFDPDKPIVITDFTPKKGGYGGNLVLYGENFGNDLSKVDVTVGGKKAKVINVKGNSLYCVIPEKAYSGHIKVNILDNNGEVIASAESETNLEYERKWLVSTFLGTYYPISSDFVEKEGTFDDCGGFEDIGWFSFDPKSNFDHLYVSGDQKKSRLIDFTANDGKGYVSYFSTAPATRIAAINWTRDENEDMIISHNQNANPPVNAHYLFSRSSNFKTSEGLVKARSNNGAMIHPINGELYFSVYFEKTVYRYDFETKEITKAFNIPNEKTSNFMIVHPTGNYAYLLCFERSYISRTDYDWDKKCFTNPYLVCGKDNSMGWNDGVGTRALLAQPSQGVFVKNPDYAGQEDEYDFYFCEKGNHDVRMLTPRGRVSTFAGRGNNATNGYADGDLRTEARFNAPKAIAYDEKRQCFYIGDSGNKIIRKIGKEGADEIIGE